MRSKIGMKLTDKIWQEIEGGYKELYDASIPLKKLEETQEQEVINLILDELWNELHHQGDIGLASYLALPQLVRIGKSKGILNWKLIGLCNVIEQQRHLGNNPALPLEFQNYYTQGLEDLKQFIFENINQNMDDTTYTIALSTLAVCSGRIKLAKAITELVDEDVMNEFLQQF